MTIENLRNILVPYTKITVCFVGPDEEQVTVTDRLMGYETFKDMRIIDFISEVRTNNIIVTVDIPAIVLKAWKEV